MIKLPEGTAAAFNQWMQDFIDNPKRYKQEWDSIREFLNTAEDDEPEYGQACVILLERLLAGQSVSAINADAPAAATS